MRELNDIVKGAESIALYKGGIKSCYPRGDLRFRALLTAWEKMTEGARRMPAFGVSIDKLTREEMKVGTWIEFNFDAEQSCAGMPFVRLLVKVNRGYKGFNIVRFYDGKYEGRCYYVDLAGGDMGPIADAAGLVKEEPGF